MEKIYKSVKGTDHTAVRPAERYKVCSLRKAIDVNIDGKLFCLAHIGQTKHKNAFQLCRSLNATLPFLRNNKEQHDFIESFKRLGVDKKINDFSTKIVLDIRRLSDKGKVSFHTAFSIQQFNFCQA